MPCRGRLLFEADTTDVFSIRKQQPLSVESEHKETGIILPTLALALCGPDAIYRWADAVGPDDSSLAKLTDPTSLSALFGPGLVQAIKSPYQYQGVLAKWFGGRACLRSGTVFGMSDPHTKS